MELRVLGYFLAVAREQSIVRAAEILNLVQKTEREISLSDQMIVGDVYIGTGETDAIRFIARAAKEIYKSYPGIHYHISSGNADFVSEQLDKGLIDFGIVFGNVDHVKYNSIELPFKDIWGVLMKRDSPLASKEAVQPEDLWDKPLIISNQDDSKGTLTSWIKKELSELEIVATYNLLFNTSLMVHEGLGYAIGLDKIINTSGNSQLCFRPLFPQTESGMHIVWKRYQVFSKAAEKFISILIKMKGEFKHDFK